MATQNRKAIEGKPPETSSTAAHAVAQSVSEKDFQQKIIDLARLNHWMVYHTADSRRSEPGFPDLVMIRGVQLIVLELKTEDGTVTDAQHIWIDGFDKVKRVEAAVARPSNWPDIERALTSRSR